jgi:glycosyltransferase EpsH
MENLSIIVPVHNLKNRTGNLFSWVFSSAFVQSQIILVHDTSDNQSASEMRNAIKAYSNIELIEEYCNSPGEARNIGLARAEREYLVFWDFDDLPIIPEFLVFFS